MKTLYPEILPYNSFFLNTANQHQVYIEESGNPDGIPVLFLHGGPCSGTKPYHRCFFDPQEYRIVLMDQRGCGQSLPFGETEHNTTQDLIADIEQLRQQLQVKQWLLFAGSWGATLGLLYAQDYPDYVSGMILRGVFLARQQDLEWFLTQGVNKIYPEKWHDLISVSGSDQDPIQGLVSVLWGDDELAQRRAAKAWMAWGGQVALGSDYDDVAGAENEHVSEKMLQQVRMELHYAQHHYFIEENQILSACHRIQHIPCIIIHGRYDLVCPLESAHSLHEALPESEYHILARAGHVASGDSMIHTLVTATDAMAQQLS